jgi:hypothetical protein
MNADRREFLAGAVATVLLSGCELVPVPAPSQGSTPPRDPGGRQTAQRPTGGRVDPTVAARLERVMIPSFSTWTIRSLPARFGSGSSMIRTSTPPMGGWRLLHDVGVAAEGQ